MIISTNKNHLLVSNQPISGISVNNDKSPLPMLAPQGMSRAKDILPLLPFGRTTLHEWSRDGRFPAGIRLSPTMVAWRNSDVIKWIESFNSSLSSNENMESENEI